MVFFSNQRILIDPAHADLLYGRVHAVSVAIIHGAVGCENLPEPPIKLKMPQAPSTHKRTLIGNRRIHSKASCSDASQELSRIILPRIPI